MPPPAAEIPVTDNGFTHDLLYDINDDCHEFEVLGGAAEPKILVKRESLQSFQSERQISVDPVSLNALSSSSMRTDSFNLMLPPAMSPPRDLAVPLPMPLQPVKTKYFSSSLPTSAATSPRFGSVLSKKKSRNNDSPKLKEEYTGLSVGQDPGNAFARSKSCGEGRACAPSLDFDMVVNKPKYAYSSDQYNTKSHSNISSKSHGSFFSKTDSNKSSKSTKNTEPGEDGFKCGALCLYLPGFSKGKPVRSCRKEDSLGRAMTSATSMTSATRMASLRTTSLTDNMSISARASLEKFECGSWASSALIHEESGESASHFFDLPSELIKGGGSDDPNTPVSAAFLFDREINDNKIKGVLKTSGSKSRRSTESPRHVRFSTSSPVSYPTSPTCITPRLRKATEDFTAFLEAQSVRI